MKTAIMLMGMICMATTAMAFGGGGGGHDSTRYNRHNPGVDNFGVHIHPDNPPLDIRFYDIKDDANAQPCQAGANVYCCKVGYVVDVATSKCVPCPSGSVATLEENFKCTVCVGEMIPNQDNTACVLPPEKINEENQCKEWGYKWCFGETQCVEKETPCSCPCELSPNGCRNLDMNFNSCCQVCDTETGLWTPAEDGLMRCNLNRGYTDKNTGKRVRGYDNVACYNGEIKESSNYHGNQQECEKYGFYYFTAPEMEYNFGVTGLCFTKKEEEADAFYYERTFDNGQVFNFDYCYTEKTVIFHEDDQSIHYYTEWQPRPNTGKKIAGIPNAQGACAREGDEVYCTRTNAQGECRWWSTCAEGKSSKDWIVGVKSEYDDGCYGACAGERQELYCASTNAQGECYEWLTCAKGKSSGDSIVGVSGAYGACAWEGDEVYCASTNAQGECYDWFVCDEGKSSGDSIVGVSSAIGACAYSAGEEVYCTSTNDQGECYYWVVCDEGKSTGDSIVGMSSAIGACAPEGHEVYCLETNDQGECEGWSICIEGKSSGDSIIGTPNATGTCDL